jgi:hypothetical protein
MSGKDATEFFVSKYLHPNQECSQRGGAVFSKTLAE